MNDEAIDSMGPIDYIVIEWEGRMPNGEAMPALIDLVDRGIVRILDLAFIAKDEAGNVVDLSIDELGQLSAEFATFEGAASGLLGEDDIAEAAIARTRRPSAASPTR